MHTIVESWAFLKKHYFGVCYTVMLGVTICCWLGGQNPFPIDEKTPVLKGDSVSLPLGQVQEHNSQLLHHMEVGETILGNLRVSRANTRMQVRLFYAAILTGLIALFLRHAQDPRPSGLLVCFIVLGMYGLDIQFADFDKRDTTASVARGKEIRKLVNLPPANTIWYSLEDSTLWAQIEAARINSLQRKVGNSVRPNFEQSVFYIFPLILSCAIPLFVLRRRGLTSSSGLRRLDNSVERSNTMTTLEATVEIAKTALGIGGSAGTQSNIKVITDDKIRPMFLKGISEIHKKLEELDADKLKR